VSSVKATKFTGNEKTIILKFGKGKIVVGEGTTAGAKIPSVIFSKCLTTEIGKEAEDEKCDLKNVIVAFEFHKIESVDVVIRQLNNIKKYFKK